MGLEAGLAMAVGLAFLQLMERALFAGVEAAAEAGKPYEPDPSWY